MRILDKDTDEVLKMTDEELESELKLIGAVGSADKMQEDVYECT